MKKRCSGILMPVSSLPGGYGIGSMGQAARDFVDFLALAGQSVWQILPVGPTSYGDSPYQSCSAFAGNPYFIDLDQLAADGLLKPEDYAKENWGTNPNYCDYALLYQKRYKVLRKAYAAFLQQRPVPGYDTPYSDDWYRFTFLSDAWLPDYCLYMAIKEENKMCDWQTWPAPLRLRDPKALEEFRTGHADELGFWAFVQYEFAKQWQALKAYANSKGIKIMGDIPIYVAADSADAWAGRELFEMDSEGHPRRVAGCPPDYFAEAKPAIEAMMAQAGHPVFDADGILQKGVILRHLALPGHVEDSFAVLDQMAAWNDADPGCFLPSVMSQYTPFYKAAEHGIGRRITTYEYRRVVNYAMDKGLVQGYMQQKSSAKEEYTPSFDLTGV